MSEIGPVDLPDATRLSRLLFLARESIEMFADTVEGRAGRSAQHQRQLVEEIDAYRAARGWSPHGYGGEAA